MHDRQAAGRRRVAPVVASRARVKPAGGPLADVARQRGCGPAVQPLWLAHPLVKNVRPQIPGFKINGRK